MIKSDVYSLGLLVLEAGLMESNDNIYMEYDVDHKVVQRKLTKLGMKYEKN